MDEYISREAIVKEIKEEIKACDAKFVEDIQIKKGLKIAIRDIKAAKTADVQLMKHGRWIDSTFYDPCEKSWEQDFEFECSNCGHKIYNKPNDNNLFCGHCGARMDGNAE
jgi:Zn finger protein HypA/HybF involved in hydrogenase expression